MTIHVTLIPGDGIGPEVVNAAVEAIEAAGAKLQWERAAAGASADPTRDARVDPPEQARLEGAAGDSGGRGLPQRERRLAQGVRPLRQRAAGPQLRRGG